MSKRRRFQAPITEYFPGALKDFSDDSAASPGHNGVLPSTPTPPSLASTLLTVGMRIRKSVPEGYKTKSTSLPPFVTPASSINSEDIDTMDKPPFPTSSTSASSLLPFCGLHKTGNLAVQTFPRPPSGGHSHPLASHPTALSVSIDQPDSISSLPSSQESNSTTTSSYNTYRPPKRSLPLELDEESFDSFHNRPFHDLEISIEEPVSPLSSPSSGYPYSHTRMPNLDALSSNSDKSMRILAQPKSRMRRKTDGGDQLDDMAKEMASGQENMGLAGLSQATDRGGLMTDFEEAGFLRSRADVEVEMGGC
ncbi:MAG: hypothetical protein Q9227_000312 [Pyrenula ochraceoflavens]